MKSPVYRPLFGAAAALATASAGDANPERDATLLGWAYGVAGTRKSAMA
jgi:hypothetical protein